MVCPFQQYWYFVGGPALALPRSRCLYLPIRPSAGTHARATIRASRRTGPLSSVHDVVSVVCRRTRPGLPRQERFGMGHLAWVATRDVIPTMGEQMLGGRDSNMLSKVTRLTTDAQSHKSWPASLLPGGGGSAMHEESYCWHRRPGHITCRRGGCVLACACRIVPARQHQIPHDSRLAVPSSLGGPEVACDGAGHYSGGSQARQERRTKGPLSHAAIDRSDRSHRSRALACVRAPYRSRALGPDTALACCLPDCRPRGGRRVTFLEPHCNPPRPANKLSSFLMFS